ncbi:MAG: DUF1858 domain-containing protein [Clostridia bacterium]|nr:DUF1858 domain-containing protein [Clostridia bacterium]
MKFTSNMTIAEVLQANPKTADVLREMGMQCLGCPSAAGESLAGAARTHGKEVNELLEKLNAVEEGEMSAETAALRMPTGAVLQRDKATFAIAPHTPGGVISPDTLRKIADVAEKYGAATLKLTSAQRIAIVGLQRDDVEKAWADLGMPPGHAVGMCVRSVKFCPGTTFCKRGQQDAVGLGMELDKLYHGLQLPSKMKMAVSGCANNCAEPAVRDIGLMGTSKGFHVMVGGNAGVRPRLGDVIAEHQDVPQALALVERIVNFYKENAKPNERLGVLIDRIGLDAMKAAVMGTPVH